MIFSVYLQVGELARSLSFYRDGLGLEVAWNDNMVAVLQSPDEPASTLVLREVGAGPRAGLGQAGVARIGWQLTSPADLEIAEERLSRHGVQYKREANVDRIVMDDPDGLRVVLFVTPPSMTGKPPGWIYWYR
jgi:catechol 2,3-dioxygenase-like lactoylglutathione lyase family enzyme